MTSPRVLVVDDDPVARQYLREVLRELGAQADLADSGARGHALARARCYDLLVVDRRLADTDAAGWLRALRADPQAASATAVAIAHSADLRPGDRSGLLAAGFHAAFEKPIAPAALAQLLALRLPAPAAAPREPAPRPRDPAPLIDDAAGLAACGSREILDGLRQLLRDELPGHRRELARALGAADRAAFDALVHRLRAAARFCGVPGLLAALPAPADSGMDGFERDFARLDLALVALGAALADAGTPDPTGSSR